VRRPVSSSDLDRRALFKIHVSCTVRLTTRNTGISPTITLAMRIPRHGGQENPHWCCPLPTPLSSSFRIGLGLPSLSGSAGPIHEHTVHQLRGTAQTYPNGLDSGCPK